MQFFKFKSILVTNKNTNFVTTISFFSSYSLLLWHVPPLKPTVDMVATVDTAVDMVDMVDTVVDTVDTVARDLPKLFLNPKPHLKPKLMLTTDMADTAVDTDMEVMVDTVVMEVMDMVDIVASDPPLPKLIPMLKRKLTVTVMAVDTDMEVMVDTVVVMEVTDMVDTVARGKISSDLVQIIATIFLSPIYYDMMPAQLNNLAKMFSR